MSDRPEREFAWDVLAKGVMDRGWAPSLSDARDRVILTFLQRGNTRPFYDWVLCGHSPCRLVIEALAHMMKQADSPGYDPAIDMNNPAFAATLPHSLEVKYGRGGRPVDIEGEIVQLLAGGWSSDLMDTGMKGKVADNVALSHFAENGMHMGDETLRKARLKYRRARQGKKTP